MEKFGETRNMPGLSSYFRHGTVCLRRWIIPILHQCCTTKLHCAVIFAIAQLSCLPRALPRPRTNCLVYITG